jgi:hypothetical protein
MFNEYYLGLFWNSKQYLLKFLDFSNIKLNYIIFLRNEMKQIINFDLNILLKYSINLIGNIYVGIHNNNLVIT